MPAFELDTRLIAHTGDGASPHDQIAFGPRNVEVRPPHGLRELVLVELDYAPDAEIIKSQPGLGQILGARVLAEFGDDHIRYASAKARKNYTANSPITRASGKSKVVVARFVHQDRLFDALLTQAFCALKASPGARAYYDKQRARGLNHSAALRHVANRLVGILRGCLKTRSLYDEDTAWAAHQQHTPAAA
ncbi:hypothetical protein GCM10027088_10100 [Nocardia goodfellowii]|uniref:Transposase IS116/IS110/IS902 C-terminal domain-containing protein n=1 Tax=Nocardia goodfellowii TaxID=882446 RepID=A0ABS4QES8_9NOCA|nr:hypothetical protein [Nocardia goodfellowii]